ncbi:hypothetical protein QQS21_003405 [Conoideocrella luteorostrata]|uniref:F-box domain-containing protein n=1 Tax=Conoideocrella luteorostrata TaxID=1105319 RepID=A0AAJ0CVZ2_9HYPO|nr:hypothetical protein QQS21_003405 [Conoideocrella luteorostrata]
MAPRSQCAPSSRRSSTLLLQIPSRVDRERLIRLRSASSASHSTSDNRRSRLSISDLPAELIYEIFDILDPIDCTCFGLSSKRFYAVLRHLYGSVPLSCRRNGPNELEWAWQKDGRVPVSIRPQTQKKGILSALQRLSYTRSHTTLDTLCEDRPGGFCRHCGINRCELHRHLSGWMGSQEYKSEYCSVIEKFVSSSGKTYTKDCYPTTSCGPPQCGKHVSFGVEDETTQNAST